jgi:endonuclease/exonuclease/phosphatase family metal-dependent hydrolase
MLVGASCTADTGEATEQTTDAVESTPRAETGPTTHLRVVAGNLTSGNLQSYDPGEGGRIFAALAPDLVLIQEFNYGANTPEAVRGFVDQTFGASYSYMRGLGKQIPNGIISRYPMLESGTWEDPQTSTRAFAWARIDIPGDKDLWAISVHLLTAGSSERSKEAQALMTRIRATVPERDYVVLGGDFNSGSRGEGCLQTFGSLFRTTGPFPVDGSGNNATNASRKKPLDWVLADRDLDGFEVPVAVGGGTFKNGLVFDSRVFQPLAAVAPVQKNDSGATNMQHMAVVRDFAVPQ